MDVLGRIVQQERERKRLEDEKTRRQDAAFHVVMALPDDERRAVLVRLIDSEERAASGLDKSPTPTTTAASRVVTVASKSEGGTFTDKAEAFVLQHPEGVRTREVGAAIGQDASAVDGSLRNAGKRGKIEKRGKFWFPLSSDKQPPPRKKRGKTIRDYIYEVFASEGRPLTSAELYRGIQRLKPDINKSSVDGEINRMRYIAKPALLAQDGIGANNAGVYRLTAGAGHYANGGGHHAMNGKA